MQTNKKHRAPAIEMTPDGVDISLLLLNLSLSYEQRIERHEDARELLEELRTAGARLYEKSRSMGKNAKSFLLKI
jgi:hypothetical protein